MKRWLHLFAANHVVSRIVLSIVFLAFPGTVATGLPQDADPTRQFRFDPKASDTELAAVLRQFIPELDDPGLDKFTQACLVRKWLSGFVPVADASSKLDLTNRFGVTHHTASVGQLLAWSERRAMGMQCGGIAELSRKVYQLLGFESVTINFGDAISGASHVTTLVKVPTSRGLEWTIQDATYNFTLLDSAGLPLGYMRLLELLEKRESKKVQIDYSAEPGQLAIYPSAIDPYNIVSLAVFSPRLLKTYDGYAAYAMQVSYTYIVGKSPAYQALLQSIFSESDPLLLFLLPISSSGEAIALEMMHRAHLAKSILADRPVMPAQATQ